MPIKLVMDARILGQRRRIMDDWEVTLPLDLTGREDALPLRDILSQVVLAEVAGFQQRQEERRLARILGPDQIAAGLADGKVDPAEHDLQQAVEPEAAVATALQAFEDGLYFVFVEGAQITGLDDPVALRPAVHMTFVRLVALAGGALC